MSDVRPPSSSAGPVAEEDSSATDVASSSPEPSDTPELDVDIVEPSEIELLAVDRDEWRDRAQRIAADFENYRRRAATQQVYDVDRATGRLAEALLGRRNRIAASSGNRSSGWSVTSVAAEGVLHSLRNEPACLRVALYSGR